MLSMCLKLGGAVTCTGCDAIVQSLDFFWVCVGMSYSYRAKKHPLGAQSKLHLFAHLWLVLHMHESQNRVS